TEAMQRVKNRVVEAITYPAVISTAILMFVLFFLVFVAPQFEDMLVKREVMAGAVEYDPAAAEQGSGLPTMTRVLFAVSHVVAARLAGIPVVALGLVAVVVAFALVSLRKVKRM